MSNGSRRISRGDRRRNDRLARLRALVTRETAVPAFDLAADKQVCALTDQDSRVLARRTVSAKAWQLREAVEWGLARAAAAGFSSVLVACEPTGHAPPSRTSQQRRAAERALVVRQNDESRPAAPGAESISGRVWLSTGYDEPGFIGEYDGVDAVTHAEFGEESVDVGLHR
jgi:hypothetical protein